MSKFKVGQNVRVIKATQFDIEDHGIFNGLETRIIKDDGHDHNQYYLEFNPTRCMSEDQLELVEESINSNKVINMNIIQKFALALKAEPQKSYQKAGITDSSDMLTEDGTKIFLTYLINKDTDFKTQVVDELLKEVK